MGNRTTPAALLKTNPQYSARCGAPESSKGMLMLRIKTMPFEESWLSTRRAVRLEEGSSWMRRMALFALCLAVCCAAAGCSTGKPKVKVAGKLSRDGQPLQGRVHMVFIPVVEEGGTPLSTYNANVAEDGSYSVPGKQG